MILLVLKASEIGLERIRSVLIASAICRKRFGCPSLSELGAIGIDLGCKQSFSRKNSDLSVRLDRCGVRIGPDGPIARNDCR